MKGKGRYLLTAVIFCFSLVWAVPEVSFASGSDPKNEEQRIDVYAKTVSRFPNGTFKANIDSGNIIGVKDDIY